ncbi:hypothetical protein VHEMI04424 [[Torrubiella] hemipterigena]|uniref:Uncharacterized protein n=1 Tax=[Torrubiella] hemipterigena TaxID=1531966 RepID=A0A0A1TE80_9HYPO|nr:hypothetical protein VHEMI04424 [[Torrubiella] hemipterigena]
MTRYLVCLLSFMATANAKYYSYPDHLPPGSDSDLMEDCNIPSNSTITIYNFCDDPVYFSDKGDGLGTMIKSGETSVMKITPHKTRQNHWYVYASKDSRYANNPIVLRTKHQSCEKFINAFSLLWSKNRDIQFDK